MHKLLLCLLFFIIVGCGDAKFDIGGSSGRKKDGVNPDNDISYYIGTIVSGFIGLGLIYYRSKSKSRKLKASQKSNNNPNDR